MPLFPQRYAEIMGGQIPLGPDSATLPDGLSECRIGRLTAAEIGLYNLLMPRD